MKNNLHEVAVQKEIESFITILQKNDINITKIIIYGSFAKGNAQSYSDIDLAVISPSFGKNEIEEMMLLQKLAWKVSDRIEAIPLTDQYLAMQYHPLIGEIKKYGKVVYEN